MTQPLFEVKDLKKYYRGRGGSVTKAVDGVSFSIYTGEVLGMVGESGCGKTSCGRTVAGLYPRDGGMVRYRGEDVHAMRGARRAAFCREVQTIFQDPYASLDGRNDVMELIAEGLDIQRLTRSAAERRELVEELMELGGLNLSGLHRYPHEFSGGMRQRIGIARALAVEPRFLLCDEPISALDVSIQAQIINLLKNLQETMGFTYLFISHDLSVVKHISDRIGVMYLGSMVEFGDKDSIFNNPLHPYTQTLFSAVPNPNPDVKMNRIVLNGDIPSPANPPKGCKFHTRCPRAMEICSHIAPVYKEYEPGHFAACHCYPQE